MSKLSQEIAKFKDYLENAFKINGGQSTNGIIQSMMTLIDAEIEAVKGTNPTYKVYTALLTQTGTDKPTATILQNTLGGTINWSYGGVGSYAGTLTGAFPVGKCIIIAPQNKVRIDASTDHEVFAVGFSSINAFFLESGHLNASTGTKTAKNDILSAQMIEVRVYP